MQVMRNFSFRLIWTHDGEVSNLIWIALLVGGLCFLIVYIFQAVGLYTIATRAGYKNRWMAFVPFFNLYYIGVCAQKNKVYNLNSKNFAIIAASLEVITVLGYVLYYVALFTVWKYISWNTTTIEGSNITYLYPSGFSADMPASLNWLGWVYLHLSDYVLILAGTCLYRGKVASSHGFFPHLFGKAVCNILRGGARFCPLRAYSSMPCATIRV